jgi:hypothetical protein
MEIMNITDLEESARRLIADKINRAEEVQMPWAVQELIQAAGEITGEGVEFYKLCAREYIYRVVKKVVDKYDQSSAEREDNDQMRLEGFDHLQVAYTVERDGERTLVPIHLISDAELLARSNEYEKQAIGLQTHAQELRSYVLSRKMAAVR